MKKAEAICFRLYKYVPPLRITQMRRFRYANVPSGNDYGYEAWQAIRHHNADALGAGRVLDAENKLACTPELGKLACKLEELGSNVVLEPGTQEHTLVQEHKQEPQRRQAPVHKLVLEHRQVPVEGTLELAAGRLELEPGSK